MYVCVLGVGVVVPGGRYLYQLCNFGDSHTSHPNPKKFTKHFYMCALIWLS